jgi:SP family facilitated glucose transporter-like MFS transporter 8
MAQDDAGVPKTGLLITVISIITILHAPLLFGIVIGSTGPSIDTMRNELRDSNNNVIKLDVPSKYVVFTDADAAIYSSLVTLGAMVGALGGGYVANAIGYKMTMLATVPMYIGSAVAMYEVSHPWFLFAARAITGIAIGVNSFIAPAYIADLAPIKWRGFFGAANQLCITIGIFLVYALGIYFKIEGGKVYTGVDGDELRELSGGDSSDEVIKVFCDWRTMALLNLWPAIMMGIGGCFMPESPSWIASKTTAKSKREIGDGAGKGGKQDVKEESIVTRLWKVRKQLTVGIGLQFFQQFSGINAVMFFCTSIMRNARVEEADTYAASVMLEQVIVTGVAVALMDLAGRKVLLLIGASVMAAACGVLGLYFQLLENQVNGILIMMLAGMYAYIAAFSIGVGAIPWLIIGEIFPANVKAIAGSLATASNWIFAFIVTLSFPKAAAMITQQGVMWVFGLCCIGLVVFAAICVPETKGKTFEEIQEFFDEPGAPKQESDKATEYTENDPLLNNNKENPVV